MSFPNSLRKLVSVEAVVMKFKANISHISTLFAKFFLPSKTTRSVREVLDDEWTYVSYEQRQNTLKRNIKAPLLL